LNLLCHRLKVPGIGASFNKDDELVPAQPAAGRCAITDRRMQCSGD
jgi:hypothetical protein